MRLGRLLRPEDLVDLRALWRHDPIAGRPFLVWLVARAMGAGLEPDTNPIARRPRAILLTGAHLPAGGAVMRELTARLSTSMSEAA